MARTKSDPALDLDLVTTKKTGVVRSAGRLVTLPFRVVGALVRLVLLPVRLAFALVRRIVTLAADLVYGLWRAILGVIGLAVGAVRLVFRVLNATVGGLIRLVFRVVFGTLKLALKILTLGRFGRSKGKAATTGAKAVSAAGAALAARSSSTT